MTSVKQQPLSVEAGPALDDQARSDYDKGKQFLEGHDPTQAAASFHNALKGFEEAGDEEGIARAVDRLGDLCLTRGEIDRAGAYFDRARTICERQKDNLSLMVVQKKLALVRRSQKRYDEAVQLYLDLLDRYQKYRNPDGAVRILGDLAALFLEQGDRTKAAEALRTAAAIHGNFKHRRHAEALLARAAEVEAGK